MIREILVGNVMFPKKPCDVIIGMNTELGEVSVLGRRVLQGTLPQPRLIDLGSVLTFMIDDKRLMHMLICHHLGNGGWRFADQYVRVGLDYLWTTHGERNYGIVQIGHGEVGTRDGADAAAIHAAIASSFLHLDLYVRPGDAMVPMIKATPPVTMQFVSGFSQKTGALQPAIA